MTFRFKKTPSNLAFLHDKLFTLEWEVKNCKWLLIHYKNGQRKSWYRLTERPYRFQRWFFRKGKGTFSNLANIKSPKIEIYIFWWYLAWPRKVVIPLNVNRLTTRDFRLHTKSQEPSILSYEVKNTTPQLKIASPVVVFTDDTLLLRLPSTSFTIQEINDLPQFDWPISSWIEKELVNNESLTYDYLQNLNNQPYHE